MKQPARVKPGMFKHPSRVSLVLVILLGSVLSACGQENTPPSVNTPVERQVPAVSTPTPDNLPIILPTRPVNNSPVVTTTLPVNTQTAPTRITTGPADGVGPVSGNQSQNGVTLLANAQIGYLQAGDLWVSDEKGGNRRQLSQGGGIIPETVYWSPSRDKVAVLDRLDGVIIFDLNGRRLSVFKPDSSTTLHKLGWSPDGRYLAFDLVITAKPLNGQAVPITTGGDIYLIDTEQPVDNAARMNAGERPIPPQRIASGFNFVWSPDGRQLAYATRARRLELVENSPPQYPVTKPGTGTPQTSLAAATPTPAANQTQFPIIRPTLATTQAGNAAALPSVTPNPFYNPAKALVPFENGLAVMSVADRRENILAYSVQLPPYPAPDGTAYPTGGTAIQTISWSPDGRSLAFGDNLSYVGLISAAGGTVRMLYGQPRAFAVDKLLWLPTGGLLAIWQTFPGETRDVAGVIATPGSMSFALSDNINCPSVSPSGQYIAYWDGTSTVILRLDGSTAGTFNGGGCAVWTQDGASIITARRGVDGSLLVITPGGQVIRQVLGIRAVEQVFFFKSS